MKLDENPFPGQNTVGAGVFKGKAKVLTSAKAKESRAVDPEMQITAEEYQEIRRCREKQKSRFDQVETSRAAILRPRVTSCILLNKWQRQKEKNYAKWLREEEYQRRCEEERYEREQAKSHWNCPFFRHCWNKGLKLPTRNNCPECSEQYWEFR